MKKVILSIATFAFALSLGVGVAVMFPQKAVADQCINIPGVIYVDTHIVCYTSKYDTATIIRVYDGRYVGSGLPCLFIRQYCGVLPTRAPAQQAMK